MGRLITMRVMSPVVEQVDIDTVKSGLAVGGLCFRIATEEVTVQGEIHSRLAVFRQMAVLLPVKVETARVL
jgi:hypothetical protein